MTEPTRRSFMDRVAELEALNAELAERLAWVEARAEVEGTLLDARIDRLARLTSRLIDRGGL